MDDKGKMVVTEEVDSQSNAFLQQPVMSGPHISRLRGALTENMSSNAAGRIITNAFQALQFFRNPRGNGQCNDPSKILCLGKVQSGKTSFFLATIALAFDNGYDIAYLLGGTKLKLKRQNLDRVRGVFKNDGLVKVFDLDDALDEDLPSLIKKGYKIILVVLKNPSKRTNLGKLQEFAQQYSHLPSLVIDDEGDEYTPGAPKAKKKSGTAGKTHDRIADIIKSFDTCTYLSVTATPQANLLLSTFDEISPNRLVLIYPGNGYTGGRSFFDTKDNHHVRIVEDKDDFLESIPDSFKEAFSYFLFSCCLKRSQGDFGPFSMLVHPSSLSVVQNDVARRISNYYKSNVLPAIQNPQSIQMGDLKDEFQSFLVDYSKFAERPDLKLQPILDCLSEVISNILVQEVNYRMAAEEDEENPALYKIKVGGNMLGRGLTINRLIVSYIYRDSKIAQVDTMYQRCRWFGYKDQYFDVCRVYMTAALQEKFMAIVANEDHMWNAMETFLDTQIDLKRFKRFFELNDERLVLTRRSVSNTVVTKVVSSGNVADECISLSEQAKKRNRELCFEYCQSHFKDGCLIDFDNSPNHRQQHLVIETAFSSFYEAFLSKLEFGYGSHFERPYFERIYDKVKKGEKPDKLTVLFMRYGKGEYRRAADGTKQNVTRLFQGRNEGTSFSGDRYPVDLQGNDYSKRVFIEVHMVDIENAEPKLQRSFPLLSFNNPLTASTIRMVTGDNIYEN